MMTWKELGDAVGKDAAALCRWSKKPGFPTDRDPIKVKEWITANISQKYKSVEHAPPSSPANIQDNSDDSLVKELLGGKADSITICRAAFQFAAKKVATAYSLGLLSAADLDGLKKTSQELRAAEVDFIELKKVQGEIMLRSDVEAVVGEIAARSVRCYASAINDTSTEISIWLADPSFVAMNADDRNRRVREWLEDKFRAVREAEADGVMKLLEAVKSDDEE